MITRTFFANITVSEQMFANVGLHNLKHANIFEAGNAAMAKASELRYFRPVDIEFAEVKDGYVDKDFVMGRRTLHFRFRVKLERKPRRRTPVSWIRH